MSNYWTVPENLPDAVLVIPALSWYWKVIVPRNEEPFVRPRPCEQVMVFSTSKVSVVGEHVPLMSFPFNVTLTILALFANALCTPTFNTRCELFTYAVPPMQEKGESKTHISGAFGVKIPRYQSTASTTTTARIAHP